MTAANLASVEDKTPSTESRASRFAIPIALLSLYVVWGSTYLAIKLAIESFPPLYMAAARFLIAGVILYVVLRWRGAPAPQPKQWLGSVAVGGLLLAGGNGLVGVAEQHVASGLAAVVIGTVPLWAALFAGIWGRWPSRFELIGLVLGFAGIILLNAGTSLSAHPQDAALLVFAAVAWAFGSMWSRHLPLPHGIMASAAEMLTGGVLLIFEGLITGERIAAMPTSTSLLAILYLIVFGSMIGFVSYSFLLRTVRPALATSYAYVNPAIAVLLGIALAGEHISAAGIAALLIIMTAVVLVIVGRQQR